VNDAATGPVVLRVGMGIVNPACGLPGTLGLIARDAADQSLWIVSCYHVLVRPPDWNGAPASPQESVELVSARGVPYARVDALRANAQLDCAAARITGDVDVELNLPTTGLPPAAPVECEPRMDVIKFGAVTGETRGRIETVQPSLRIGARPGQRGQLSSPGDSGAVWFVEATGAPVALHRKGNVSGVEFALASPITAVLAALRLELA